METMRSLALCRRWVVPATMLALAACTPPRVVGAGRAEPLEGTAWRLWELNGQPAVEAGGAAPTLSFAADEPRASGNGGCNQFNGPYTRNGESLRFGPLASTRRACVDPAGNSQETAYLGALQSTTRYSVYDDLLVLYAQNQVVARLRRSGG
jgi:heat shock protein HslJ